MIRKQWFVAVALLFVLGSGGAMAQDVVVNGRFEMGASYAPYWAASGTSTLHQIWQYDVTGSGISWAWESVAWNDGTEYSNTLTQTIAVEGGVTYDVSANFAYENC